MEIYVTASDETHRIAYLIPCHTEKQYRVITDIVETIPFTSQTNARKAIENWEIKNPTDEYDFVFDYELTFVIKEFDIALGNVRNRTHVDEVQKEPQQMPFPRKLNKSTPVYIKI